MPVSAHIERAIRRRWADTEKSRVAITIVTRLSEEPEEQLRMLTWSALQKMAEYPSINDEFVEVVLYLAGSEPHVLEMQFLFIDDDGEEFAVPRGEVYQSQVTRELVHPRTGETVSDFEHHLLPYFTPSEAFLRERSAG